MKARIPSHAQFVVHLLVIVTRKHEYIKAWSQAAALQLISADGRTAGSHGPRCKAPSCHPRASQHRQSLLSTRQEPGKKLWLKYPVSSSAQETHMQRERWTDGWRSTSNRNSPYLGPARFFHIISYFLFSSFPSFWLGSEVEAPKCHQQRCPGSRDVHSSQDSPFSSRYRSDIAS